MMDRSPASPYTGVVGDEQGTDEDLAAIWLRLLPLFTDRHDTMLELVRRHGLTPPHGFTLVSLSFAPLRMRDLADLMVCDASYITSIVDRLEELGLASRRASDTDRRVKEIELTEAGRAVAAEVAAVMTAPPPAFAALTGNERATLRSILQRVLPEPDFPPSIFRSNRR